MDPLSVLIGICVLPFFVVLCIAVVLLSEKISTHLPVSTDAVMLVTGWVLSIVAVLVVAKVLALWGWPGRMVGGQ